MNQTIQNAIASTREQLTHHKIYQQLKEVSDIQLFMESHVYAVWDFMTLLKSLQIQLTGMQLPWRPVTNSATARFINEIVLEEETDRDIDGDVKSHFEMYLEAMEEIGADTTKISALVRAVTSLADYTPAFQRAALSKAEKEFLQFTFDLARNGKIHQIAAAFTFGREEVIPDMFLAIIEKNKNQDNLLFPKLKFYLRRHIELDGDEHGPLSLAMMNELCDTREKLDEIIATAKRALELRIQLWDDISERLSKREESSGVRKTAVNTLHQSLVFQ